MRPVRDGLVVQIPDVHIPGEHRKAVANLIAFIGDVQPALVLMTGDYLDCLSTARWSADTVAENGSSFQHEIDRGREVLSRLRDVYAGPITFQNGNHEDRLEKWGRTRGKGIWGLDCLTIPNLLSFDDLNVTAVNGPFEFAPGCISIHGARLGPKAGQSVTKELERFGNAVSVTHGHTHRLALVYRKTFGGEVWGVEAGHVSDQRKAHYLQYGVADWKLGSAVFTVEGRNVTPQLLPMRPDGSFSFERVRWAA